MSDIRDIVWSEFQPYVVAVAHADGYIWSVRWGFFSGGDAYWQVTWAEWHPVNETQYRSRKRGDIIQDNFDSLTELVNKRWRKYQHDYYEKRRGKP